MLDFAVKPGRPKPGSMKSSIVSNLDFHLRGGSGDVDIEFHADQTHERTWRVLANA
jgi:hypothetical protein